MTNTTKTPRPDPRSRGERLLHNALEGRGRTEVKAVADHLLGIIQELKDHLDYRGWGNSWECRIVSQPGGLRDRVEALLKKAVTP